ncbi:hypothetical protein HO133_005476 [Letharia lupina]|uniref:CID domain-containing protein n=1 Tax=Letharia lupina TaxID=560253 RepID=A0A8H6C8Z9_9LECA|nr:uncharacterized protein HO133_005476 [Letharia lupina]KAF6218933.1 hypothetical protein HO133_005476 [Letharia lupina]
MASHSLAIAKASLAAGMIRPDPTSVPKLEIARFHTLLEAVLRQCSSANIQLCKDWLLKNIIPSAARIIAIGKYLVALSLSFAKAAYGDDQKPAREAAPSAPRRQLHVLYLLNDLLHHTKYHIESPSAYSITNENVQSCLVDLFGAASAYSLKVYVKQHKCITDLLDIWEGQGYYQSSYIQKLRDTASTASKVGHANTDEDTKLSGEALSEERKDAPYILPPSHGDPLTPFYDLPAGNMMPHVMPNSARAVNPQLVKALQFTAGPADENLVKAVKDFLKNVDSLDAHGFEGRQDDMDIDELGQSVLGDEVTGNILEGEGYYGWSKAFCEKMKKRGVGLGDIGKIMGRAGSIDRSLSPRKRRRYSDAGSSRSRDRTMDRSRSSSLSSDQGSRRRSSQRPSSKSRNLSRERRRYRSLRSRSRSRSPPYSPPQTVSVFQRPPPPASPQPMQQTQARRPSPPSSMPFQHPFSKGFPLGPGAVPIPPPPPPNYHGPWPPPPPPMPNLNRVNAVPAPAPPTGPKIAQNHGAAATQRGSHSGLQSQAPQNFGGWGQQQLGHVSEFPYGDRGGTQQPFNGNIQNSRGRGYGRGGWTR